MNNTWMSHFGPPDGITIYDNQQTFASHHACPDLLTLDDIGAADNLRGRVVRLFFYLMRAWPT